MSVKSKLRALRSRHPKASEVAEIERQISLQDNDRGAALLAVAILDNAMRYAIWRRFIESAHRFSHQAGSYFENEGMLSTFDAKIIFAYTLSITGPNTNHNLDIIKHIRNTYAHSGVPISFSTEEIADMCNMLKAPSDLKGRQWTSAREKFISGCFTTAVDLIEYADSIKRVKAETLDPARMIPVMPGSLP